MLSKLRQLKQDSQNYLEEKRSSFSTKENAICKYCAILHISWYHYIINILTSNQLIRKCPQNHTLVHVNVDYADSIFRKHRFYVTWFETWHRLVILNLEGENKVVVQIASWETFSLTNFELVVRQITAISFSRLTEADHCTDDRLFNKWTPNQVFLKRTKLSCSTLIHLTANEWVENIW